MKLLRKASIPVATLLMLAANTASQREMRDAMWVAWIGAILIVLAGVLCVGRRWMYFVFPVGVAALLFLFGVAHNYGQAADYFGHRPEGNELAAFINMKWLREYGAEGPYWLAVDVIYFIASCVAGWLYGTWSMLVPGAVSPASQTMAPPKRPLIRKPFKIVLWVVFAVIIIGMIFGGSR